MKEKRKTVKHNGRQIKTYIQTVRQIDSQIDRQTDR